MFFLNGNEMKVKDNENWYRRYTRQDSTRFRYFVMPQLRFGFFFKKRNFNDFTFVSMLLVFECRRREELLKGVSDAMDGIPSRLPAKSIRRSCNTYNAREEVNRRFAVNTSYLNMVALFHSPTFQISIRGRMSARWSPLLCLISFYCFCILFC